MDIGNECHPEMEGIYRVIYVTPLEVAKKIELLAKEKIWAE